MKAVTARELILSGARLAGEGIWQIVIPEQITTLGADLGAGSVFTSAPLTIAGNNQAPGPQLMERWELNSLRLPIGLLIMHAKEAGAPPEAEVTAVIRRNGDIVFTAEQPVKTVKFTEEEAVANTAVSSDLVNSVSLDRSQQLTVELQLAASVAIKKNSKILLAGSVNTTGGNFVTAADTGFLGYDALTLTGHRQL